MRLELVGLLLLLAVVAALTPPGQHNVAKTGHRNLRSLGERTQQDRRQKKSAAKIMRAFSGQRRDNLQDSSTENEKLEKIAEDVTGGDSRLMQLLRELNIFTRAVEDPMCSMNINCLDGTNRKFLDGVKYRTSSGVCNNLGNFKWGMAEVQHRRLLPNEYQNGKWAPRSRTVSRKELPTSRSVSNKVHKTDANKPDNNVDVSLALFYFMQFIDHDLVYTPQGVVSRNTSCCTDPREFCLPIIIRVTDNDEYFPVGYCMDARRSDTVFLCGNPNDFQNQYNEITAYLDASMVYGSSEEEMNDLRTFVSGFLKQSTKEFMPEAMNVTDLPCDTEIPGICFQAGDHRANVIPGLTSYHTIFVREHNRLAAYLASTTDWSDEKIFQETRKIVAAEIQRITFNEMLPLVLDSGEVARFNLYGTYSYNASLDASIIQEFSLAFRYHTLMPSSLHYTEASGSSYINSASYDQEDTYEDPSYLFHHGYKGIDQIGQGMAFNKCPYANGLMNDAARNKLFFDGTDSYDLAALNIERGREWGTPAYYKYRTLCGVDSSGVTSWTNLTSTHDADVIAKLQAVYESPRDIDLWTGLITERKIGTSLSGKTQSCLVAMQFANAKYGDRFWHETTNLSVGLRANQLREIKKVTLAKIMCDNLDVSKMPTEVFKTSSTWTDCNSIPGMDLGVWASKRK